MSRANQRRVMTETRPNVYNRYKQCQKVRFLSYAWKYWTVQQNDSYMHDSIWAPDCCEFCDKLLAEQNFAGIKYQYTDAWTHLLLFIEFYTHYMTISVFPQSQCCGMEAQIWPSCDPRLSYCIMVVFACCWRWRSDNFVIGLTNVSPVVIPPTLWNYTVCGQAPWLTVPQSPCSANTACHITDISSYSFPSPTNAQTSVNWRSTFEVSFSKSAVTTRITKRSH